MKASESSHLELSWAVSSDTTASQGSRPDYDVKMKRKQKEKS